MAVSASITVVNINKKVESIEKKLTFVQYRNIYKRQLPLHLTPVFRIDVRGGLCLVWLLRNCNLAVIKGQRWIFSIVLDTYLTRFQCTFKKQISTKLIIAAILTCFSNLSYFLQSLRLVGNIYSIILSKLSKSLRNSASFCSLFPFVRVPQQRKSFCSQIKMK